MTTITTDRDLDGRTFADAWEEYESRGFVIFPRVLSGDTVEALRAALMPHFDKLGRNDFEGHRTNRVYALLAKSPLFAELVLHPLALAFAERELGPSLLLSACLAINLHPGESAQPWHYDDSFSKSPRPRPALGVSMFWSIDEPTVENGATEVMPGSHRWGDDTVAGDPVPADCVPGASHLQGGSVDRAQPVALTMPPGSLAIAKGTLWHRGGANRSTRSRLIVTPQYCAGWLRQIENMVLAVPPSVAAGLPERAQALLGYSIEPPFMGYVDGMHPQRVLARG